jgi:hypothetical protein
MGPFLPRVPAAGPNVSHDLSLSRLLSQTIFFLRGGGGSRKKKKNQRKLVEENMLSNYHDGKM